MSPATDGPADPEQAASADRVELIAHRAGNHSAGVEPVRALADTIELDVRLERGRMVVRHPRRIWFTTRLWEPWRLLPRDATALRYDDAIGPVGGGLGLWIDCKGFSRQLPDRAVRAARAGDPSGSRRLTVSSKAWWALASVAHDEDIRVIRSVSNRWELFLLRRLPSRIDIDGVVARSDLLDGRLVRELKQRYDLVFSWSIPDVAIGSQLTAWGVDGLIIDDPEVLGRLARGSS